MATAWMKALGSRMAFNSNTIDQPGKSARPGAARDGLARSRISPSRVALLIGINPLVAMSGGIPQGNPTASSPTRSRAAYS
jgi:hypothetical protein